MIVVTSLHNEQFTKTKITWHPKILIVVFVGFVDDDVVVTFLRGFLQCCYFVGFFKVVTSWGSSRLLRLGVLQGCYFVGFVYFSRITREEYVQWHYLSLIALFVILIFISTFLSEVRKIQWYKKESREKTPGMPTVRLNRVGLVAAGTFVLAVFGLVLTTKRPLSPSMRGEGEASDDGNDGDDSEDGLVLSQLEHPQSHSQITFTLGGGALATASSYGSALIFGFSSISRALS
jgi:hypothetical protein